MSEAVDTRVVEAKFDSAQFEKGVDRTVKKLDELKKSLDLEESGKSIAQLASKTQEATEKASGALEKLENRITTFTGMLRNKLLSGIADEVVGAVFKMKNAFEGLVKSLSTGQISYGMQRYVDVMGSVRTMVFSGIKEDAAYAAIERLGTYADQTSYSLDQLVSTMSKFKTAGASLDTAERMVVGLSNAAASMGVNAQEASRAYLNLQQAYSKGAMLQNDWISFESLPMVGEKFNQAILDAAVHIGTLKKEANGTYSTINKIDKQVKTSGADAKGITAQNLGTKLSSRWFNKQVMEEVFGSTYYFNLTDVGDVGASELASGIKTFEKGMNKSTQAVKKEQGDLKTALKEQKITEEEYAEQLSQFATEDAYAKFDDIDKDFRENAPDPKEMQAALKKEIEAYVKENGVDKLDYDVLYTKQLETYLDTIEEKMLDEKKKEIEAEKKELKKLYDAGEIGEEDYTKQLKEYDKALEDFTKNNNLTRWGWEAYRAGQEARSFNDVLNTLKDTISRGWARSFELIFGKLDEAKDFFTWLTENDLAKAIYSIGEFRNKVLEAWQGNELEGGRNDLIEALKTLDGLLGRLLGRFIIFNDEDETFEDRASEIGSSLAEMTMHFREAVEKLDAWFTDDRVSTIREFFSNIGKTAGIAFKALGIGISFVHKLLVAFSPVIDVVGKNINKILDRINTVLESQGLSSLRTGLDNVITVVTPLAAEDGPLVKFIDILGEIGAFFAEMAVGSFTSTIQFFSDTLGFLIELFGGTSAQKAEDGVGILGGMKNSIMELGNACKEALQFVADFFHNLYEDILVLLGIHEVQEGEEGGFFTNLKKFLDGNEFIASVKKWIKDIPKNLKKLWNTIDEWLFGKKIKIVNPSNKGGTLTVRVKSGFSKMLDDLFKTVKEFITVDVPKKAKEIWNSIIEAIFGKPTQSTTASNIEARGSDDMVKSGFQTWFEKAIQKVKDWINDIPGKIKELWNKIIDFIFYRDPEPDEVNPDTNEAYGPNERVKNAFALWLEDLPKNILDWIKDIPNKVSKIWNAVIDLIFGPKVTKEQLDQGEINPRTGLAYQEGDRVGTAFGDWLLSIPGTIKEGIDKLPEKIAEIWDKVVDLIFGKEVTAEQLAQGAVDPKTGLALQEGDRVKDGFSLWLDNTITSVKTWIKSVPDQILDLWDTVLGAIFNPKKEPEIPEGSIAVDQAFYDETKYLYGSNAVSNYVVMDDKDRNGILAAAEEFVSNLGLDIGAILSSLPTKVVEGWNFSLGLADSLFTNLTAFFENENAKHDLADTPAENIVESIKENIEGVSEESSPLLTAIITFGQKISKMFTSTVPGLLSAAWMWFKNDGVKGLGEAVLALFGLQGEEDWWGKINEDAEKFGKEIGDKIRNLPQNIREAVDSVKQTLSGEDDWVKQREEIIAKYTEYDEFGDSYTRNVDQMNKEIKEAEEKFRKDHSGSGIWSVIKEIFGSIGDVAIDFGPDILDGINTALDWLGQQMTKVTEAFADKGENESVTEAIARHMGADGENEPSALVQALGRIGETIKNLIINIIPNFIKEGINVVAEEIPKLFSGIFGGGEENKEDSGFFDNVKKALPSVDNVIDNAKGMLQGENTQLDTLLKLAEGQSGKTQNVSDLITEYTEKKKRLAEKVSSSNKNYKDVVNGVVWLSDEAKADEDELKRTSQVLEKLKELEENGIEKVAMNVDTGDVVGMENAKAATESATDILSTLANLAKSDTLGTVGIIAAIGWVLHELKDITSLSDEFESPGYTAKWIGIGILITGVVTILGYLTYLASQSDSTTFDKVSKVFTDLGGFIEKLAWIMVLLKGVSAAGDWGEAVGKKNDAQTVVKGASGALVSKSLDALGGLADTAAIIGTVSLTGSTIMESVQAWIGDLSTSFALLESGFLSLSRAADTVISIGDKIPAAISAVVRDEDGIRSFFDAIMHIFEEDYQTTKGGNKKSHSYSARKKEDYSNDIIEVIEQIVEISGYFSLIKNAFSGGDIHAKEITDALTDIIALRPKMIEFNEFAKSDDFETFKYAIASLGSALSMYTIDSASKLIDSEQITAAIDALNEILKGDKFAELAKGLTTAGSELPDAQEIYSQSEKIIMIAKTAASLGEAAQTITEDTAERINALFTALSEIKIEEGEGEDAKNGKITKLANVFGILGNAMSTFANNTKDLRTLNLDKVERTINLTVKLMEALRIYSQGVFEKVFSGDASIESFGVSFSAFAIKLNDGLNALGGSGALYDAEKLEVALKAMSAIVGIYGQLMSTIYKSLQPGQTYSSLGFTGIANGLTGEGGLAPALADFATEIHDNSAFDLSDEDVRRIDKVLHIIKQLGDFAVASNGVSFTNEMWDLKDALNVHNPFRAIAQAIGTAKEYMQDDPGKFDNIESFIEAFGILIQGLSMLASYTKDASSTNVSGRWLIGDLVSGMTTVFEELHNNFGTITTFFKDLETFNLEEIDRARMFFEALYYLGNTMHTFADNSIFTGATNFEFFDWSTVLTKLSEALADEQLVKNMKIFGGNIVIGLTNGIREKTSDAVKAMEDLAAQISGTFTVKMEIGSPSKLFEEFGGYLDAGLANGIEDGSSDAIDSAATLANNVIDMFRNVWGVQSPSKVAKKLAMYFDEGLNDGLLKYGALPVGAAEDTADSILDVMFRALENNDTPEDVKGYAQTIIDALTDFDEKDIDKGYWMYLENMERYNRAVEKEAEKAKENSSSFWDVITYLFRAPEDPTNPKMLEGFIGSIFGADFLGTVELSEEDQETVKNAIKLLKGEVNEVASEAVKEEAGNNIFTSMSIWDWMMFRTKKYFEHDENSGLAKAGKFGRAIADWISKIKQNLIPNLSGVVDEEGIWNTIIHMYTDKSGEMQKLTSALLSDMTQIGDKYPELSGVAAALGEVFKQLDKSGGGWDVLGQVLDAAAKEFTDNDAIQYVNKIFGQLRSAAEGKEGSELGYSITDVLLSSVNEFLTGKFGDSPVVNAVATYANSIPEQIKEAIASGKQGAELVEYLLGLVRNGAEDYLSEENPLAAMVVEKISELIGLSKDEDLTIEPKVKPVLEMSDDFKSGMDTINSFLGGFFNPTAWFNGENPTLNTNTSLDLASQLSPLVQNKDYSGDLSALKIEMGEMKAEMASFNRSVSSMKFVIKGEELTQVIGPSMNQYLGYEDMTRGSRYEVVTS